MGKRVIIVGAGLSGLICAREFQRKGLEARIIEASDGPGGRIRTDLMEDFRLDRGFQVYFEAYPHARQVFDLAKLQMKSYRPGALIYTGDGLERVDAFRPLETLFSKAFGLTDKIRLGLLAASTKLGAGETEDISTEKFLRNYGFSEIAIQRFFRPFFGGIFLDRTLSTSSIQLTFLLKMLISGRVSTPSLGMGELTRQIAGDLIKGSVSYHSVATDVSEGGIVLENGDRVEADAVVLTVDAKSAAALLKEPFDDESVDSRTIFFEADDPPVEEPIIVLNGTGYGDVNLVAPLSVVSPSLAPAGKHLVAVTTSYKRGANELVERTKEECAAWFPTRGVSAWRHLKTVYVPFAQFRQDPGFRDSRPNGSTSLSKVFRSGEILTNSSIDGACQAAKITVDAVSESIQ